MPIRIVFDSHVHFSYRNSEVIQALILEVTYEFYLGREKCSLLPPTINADHQHDQAPFA
jgi:hypothetical protein